MFLLLPKLPSFTIKCNKSRELLPLFFMTSHAILCLLNKDSQLQEAALETHAQDTEANCWKADWRWWTRACPTSGDHVRSLRTRHKHSGWAVQGPTWHAMVHQFYLGQTRSSFLWLFMPGSTLVKGFLAGRLTTRAGLHRTGVLLFATGLRLILWDEPGSGSC